MATVCSPDTVTVILTVDLDEMSRRGRLGAAARAERHDCSELSRRAMATRLAKMTPAERRRYFVDLAQRSHAARRARADAENGGEA
jgi:hypothetical protein